MTTKTKIRVRFDRLTRKWSAYANGRRVVSGWDSPGMARAKAREYLSWAGQGGAFGGGFVTLTPGGSQ